MKLTSTQIKYILAMYELQADGPIRMTQIANYLGVTKPTVHSMLTQLKKFEMVCQMPNGRLVLTEQGNTLAQEYRSDYQRVRTFLQVSLRMNAEAANESAALLLGSENKAAGDWKQCLADLEEVRA